MKAEAARKEHEESCRIQYLRWEAHRRSWSGRVEDMQVWVRQARDFLAGLPQVITLAFSDAQHRRDIRENARWWVAERQRTFRKRWLRAT